MDNLDDLNLRIERVISEIKDIKQLFETNMADPRNNVSFSHVKEIESSIDRLKKQKLLVPEELKQLKLKLLSTYENRKVISSLYNSFLDRIHNLILPNKPQAPLPQLIIKPIKPQDNEKPLGRKGNNNLDDYLIPVIKLMWCGLDHREAFQQIAKTLDVTYNTVSSQCTRSLGLTTDEFINRVTSRSIVGIIENKFPDQFNKITSHLKISEQPS